MRRGLFIVGLGFVLAASNASAQDGTDAADAADAADGLDVTMTLMSAGDELPDVITALIELPKDDAGDYIPSENAVAHSARGHETANAAREDGRAFGEAMAAAARENREDAARGGRPDLSELRPDNVPELPNVPNLPDQAGPPELPVTPPGPPGQG